MELPTWCEAEDWCPITVTSQLLGRKWHPVIIHRLLQKPMGFNELKRESNGISAKVLTESLEDLRKKKIIERSEMDDNAVRYNLTDTGKSLEPLINSMAEWGAENADKL